MRAARGIMAAVSPEGAIGWRGSIPWHYRGDMRRVKRLTLGTTLIMGRHTWESLGGKPLAGRTNWVVTQRALEGVPCFPSVAAALGASEGAVWFFGGAGVYAESMAYADFIDLVYVPDRITHADAVLFPPIDPQVWQPGELLVHEDEPALTRRVFTRREALVQEPGASLRERPAPSSAGAD